MYVYICINWSIVVYFFRVSCTIVFYEPNNAFSGLGTKTETERWIDKEESQRCICNDTNNAYLYIYMYTFVHMVYICICTCSVSYTSFSELTKINYFNSLEWRPSIRRNQEVNPVLKSFKWKKKPQRGHKNRSNSIINQYESRMRLFILFVHLAVILIEKAALTACEKEKWPYGKKIYFI